MGGYHRQIYACEAEGHGSQVPLCRSQHLVIRKIPWRSSERVPTPVFWPGGFHGIAKSQTGLNDFHFQFTIQPRLNKNLLRLQISEESICSTEPGSAVHPG